MLAVVLCGAQSSSPPGGSYDAFPGDIPATFEPVVDRFDFTRRKVMIPMRDGVKLHTVILVPKGAQSAPILLTRTPYNALWDREDIHGAIAVYQTLEPKDTNNDKVFLVMGPWNHGRQIEAGTSLGPLRFGSDTALYFRREILRPFLRGFGLGGQTDRCYPDEVNTPIKT